MARQLRFRTRTRDFCIQGQDDIFQAVINGVVRQVRKVEPRNTPTVINAAFNYRNFWDGRANNVFNGVDVFGPRETAAGSGRPDRRPRRTRAAAGLQPLALAQHQPRLAGGRAPRQQRRDGLRHNSFAAIGRSC